MPNENCGRTGSLMLMLAATLVAILGEFWFYSYFTDLSAWDCENTPTCYKYSAVERVAFSTCCFFATMAILGLVHPSLHNKGWDLKFLGWFALTIGLFWANGEIFDTHGFVWFARVVAFIFLVLQQIILVDFAYTVNGWLYEYNTNVLLGACISLYVVALVGIVLMFVYYTGCDSNNTFISMALLIIVAFTAIQLTSDPEYGHNLLTSGAVAAYVTYLTYIGVSSNPYGDGVCNPTYSDSTSVLAVVLGLVIALVSTSATIYFSSSSMTTLLESDVEASNNSQITRDLLTNDAKTIEPNPESRPSNAGLSMRESLQAHQESIVWKFNLVMVMITCYWCMVLTDWGDSTSTHSNSDPTAGKTIMWMNIAASWICSGLYVWTLLAPRLFPDRNFS